MRDIPSFHKSELVFCSGLLTLKNQTRFVEIGYATCSSSNCRGRLLKRPAITPVPPPGGLTNGRRLAVTVMRVARVLF